MPESRRRKKKDPVGTVAAGGRQGPRKKPPSPPWFGGLILALFGIGIVWLVAFYITGNQVPVLEALGNGNILVGFGFILAGFALATQWR